MKRIRQISKKDKVLIYGAGGHGKVVLDILLECGMNVLGFLDDDKNKIGQSINGFKIFGDRLFLAGNRKVNIALGIGDNKIREAVYRKVNAMRLPIISAIHPCAIISMNTQIGEGVVIMPGVVINTGTVLENGVVVNTGATIDHDCHLGRFCQIWPGAHLAGTVKVGQFSYIGTGVSVIQNINIGKNAVIGAGAAVISKIPDNVTVVGVPARVIKK
jgi:sugar O-acyltransferase (sialic acid O-acetyltransferase NeuD family)